MKKGLTTGAAVVALALLGAPAALASTVTIGGGNTVKVAESGKEGNSFAVSWEKTTNAYRVVDRAAGLTPSGTCTAVDAHTATCPGTGIKTISVDAGDRDDVIALDSTIPATVAANAQGGPGNDVLSGHGTLDGGSGNDTLTGSLLADTLRGSSGRDALDGGNGPDDISGGGGTDTLTYPATRTTPVSVTIGAGNGNDGGLEDQGPSGARDTVHGDVEVVVGTPQGDLLAGDSSSETLIGAGGDDTLVGNNGNDQLLGDDGNDLLVGGRGRDVLRGWTGDDRLFGGPSNDFLAGGPDNDLLVGNLGSDALKGKGGIDTLRARDGVRDLKINCGPGSNKAESATRDRHLDPRARSC